MNKHPNSEIENELKKLFPVDSHPYVECKDVNGRAIGQATRFYFEASNLVIVFEWLLFGGKYSEKTKLIFANPQVSGTGDVLRLAYGFGNQIAITHLVQYKFWSRAEYLRAKRAQPI